MRMIIAGNGVFLLPAIAVLVSCLLHNGDFRHMFVRFIVHTCSGISSVRPWATGKRQVLCTKGHIAFLKSADMVTDTARHRFLFQPKR